ncbi:hypothetical protein NST74_04855 [Paenibacillus sp. FSL F4-0125]|uniref:hypothetical protein n=1 Tax=Paenibacillus sp. FSL F4-0125 TaxID=2954730 RepID=UPI0030F8A684
MALLDSLSLNNFQAVLGIEEEPKGVFLSPKLTKWGKQSLSVTQYFVNKAF